MPAVTETYERNLQSPKFYSSAVVGRYRYNPTIIEYYGSDDALVRIEEIFDGVMMAQTISGSGYAEQWPSYTYSITYQAWEETTYSG
jgi:hypothetical protein